MNVNLVRCSVAAFRKQHLGFSGKTRVVLRHRPGLAEFHRWPLRTHDEVALELSDKKMKRLIPLLAGGLLILSLVLNIFLWSRLSSQSNRLRSEQASASEIDELRRQNQELQINATNATDSASAAVRKLARPRNEVAQLRNQAREAAADTAQLRSKLAAAAQDLARAESELADSLKRSPEEWQRMIQDQKSRECVSNMKQIGLAVRIWANDHNDVFPPDFISVKEELNGP